MSVFWRRGKLVICSALMCSFVHLNKPYWGECALMLMLFCRWRLVYVMASVSSQPQFRYTQPPSKVLHLRNLPWECTEEELIELGKPFGQVVNTKCNVGANRNQAFIEFVSVTTLFVNGRLIICTFLVIIFLDISLMFLGRVESSYYNDIILCLIIRTCSS